MALGDSAMCTSLEFDSSPDTAEVDASGLNTGAAFPFMTELNCDHNAASPPMLMPPSFFEAAFVVHAIRSAALRHLRAVAKVADTMLGQPQQCNQLLHVQREAAVMLSWANVAIQARFRWCSTAEDDKRWAAR